MRQSDLERELALKTGESRELLRERGFSEMVMPRLMKPHPQSFRTTILRPRPDRPQSKAFRDNVL